ncbi:MAG: 3-hydroxyacyl-CoA dehydrogenase NAD-binding domain-containing protein, partial [Alphaproteobacteria bacterium]|nr:3-hydroxyacyl-CoA dehydrogenase NAD-binding domain-containing protein [Alphaproteobacteria bacterium]
MTDPVAIIGAGLVGRAWAIVFARAGIDVRLFDLSPDIAASAKKLIGESLEDLAHYGLIDDRQAILARVSVADTLAACLDGAGYAQESVFERVDAKREIYQAIDAVIGKNTIVGSSSSGIPASAYTEGLGAGARMLVAHPVNPPHLARVVELVPAPWTASETVDAVWRLMERVDQVPVRVTREIEGFVLNRLQGVLLDEAFRLVRDGFVSAEDLDKTLTHGLGLRWSFIGPFETIDLNAP